MDIFWISLVLFIMVRLPSLIREIAYSWGYGYHAGQYKAMNECCDGDDSSWVDEDDPRE